MKNVVLDNIPSMSVEQMTNTLTDIYVKSVKKGVEFKALPSMMLWGPPGVGKSQAIRQIARALEEETGKRTVVTDVRLLLFNPIDLRGIPTANADKTLAVWLKPQIFQMDSDKNVINILFLDEISAAPMAVQAAAYQITLDRVVGEHKLPDNCIVIAAGNRVTDKSVAFKMPKALANRLCHIEIESTSESFMKWAIANDIDQRILGFLSFRSDYLMGFDPSNDDLAFATPRSWEMVSNILKLHGGSITECYSLIAGCVGVGVATELESYCRIYSKLPNIEDIFAGKRVEMPKSLDIMYALVSAMVAYAREHKKDMTKIANSIKFAMEMPSDFSTVLLKSYLAIDKNYREKLMKIPEFYAWMRKRGNLLNGSI